MYDETVFLEEREGLHRIQHALGQKRSRVGFSTVRQAGGQHTFEGRVYNINPTCALVFSNWVNIVAAGALNEHIVFKRQ